MSADLQTPYFTDRDKAREYLEAVRWNEGQFCPHCGVMDNAVKLEPKGKKGHARQGVWQCRDCRKQFTVTVGTIFEDSHIPLNIWLLAIHLMCSSKKGMSAHQLHRMLGVTYKSAWFMAHRIRHAMAPSGPPSKMSGPVEVDEVYIGGKEKGIHGLDFRSKKSPVVSLLDRERGIVRSFHVERVTAENIKPILEEHIMPSATINTDEHVVYGFALGKKRDHKTVTHTKKEYARREKGELVTTNSVEGFFSLLRRGLYGTYHHVAKHHLHRYLAEFDYRYSNREASDGVRALGALKGFEGKRLTYQTTRQPKQG